MFNVAILGASGFVGTRAVEMLYLGGYCKVRPIVRSFSSLARIARFDLDWRIADARDQDALAKAFAGCDAVIHSVAGDSPIIIDSIEPVYLAAQAANVRRLVYLSTASVHGQAPAPGVDETSPLSEHQPIAYNNAKVKAEKKLISLHQNGAVQVVILRPGIVTGPRSPRWLVAVADDLLAGKAYLIDNGAGICNSIYVDNLVHGIYLSLIADAGVTDGQVFLLGDQEKVTWLDVYTHIAKGLGIDPETIPRVPLPHFKRSLVDVLRAIRASRPVQAVLPLIPNKVKLITKTAIKEAGQSDGAADGKSMIARAVTFSITQEMALLQSCHYKLPFFKAERMLGYRPPVSFEEGMRRSVAWLAFADYPVVEQMLS
jgi:nucleoside-diphosphate-sugar epimerase